MAVKFVKQANPSTVPLEEPVHIRETAHQMLAVCQFVCNSEASVGRSCGQILAQGKALGRRLRRSEDEAAELRQRAAAAATAVGASQEAADACMAEQRHVLGQLRTSQETTLQVFLLTLLQVPTSSLL